MCEELESAKSELGETQADVSSLKDIVSESVHTMKLLTSIIAKQNKQINSMERDIDELKNRSMRDNVIFHNIPEKKDDDLKETVAASMLTMGLDLAGIEYERIHRMGDVNPEGKPRPVVAKPTRYKDTQRLLGHRRREIDKKTDPWISPQFPESVREQRIQLAQMADHAHKKDRSVKTKITHTTLFINGQKVSPPLAPTSAAEVLLLPKPEQRELSETKFVQTNMTSVKGSTFVGRGINVKSLNDVRKAQKSLMLHAETVQTSHNIISYWLPNGDSGYYDDHDYSMGRRMLQTLEQLEHRGVMVVLTRNYGGNKLGPQRFEIARDITKKVSALLYKEESSHQQRMPSKSLQPPAASSSAENTYVIQGEMRQRYDVMKSTCDVTNNRRSNKEDSSTSSSAGSKPSEQDEVNIQCTSSVKDDNQGRRIQEVKEDIQENGNDGLKHDHDQEDLDRTASSDLFPEVKTSDEDNEIYNESEFFLIGFANKQCTYIYSTSII